MHRLSFLSMAALGFASEDEVAISLSRTDTLAADVLKEEPSDAYFEGYIQALIDSTYHEYRVVVFVKDGVAYLANLPKNRLVANSIVNYVRDVPGVKDVKVIGELPIEDKELHEKYAQRPQTSGVWFPQQTELYQPMLADPRQVNYSAGYRSGDRVVGVKAVELSLGDDFPFYRWLDVFRWHGDLQFGVEGGVWSVFNVDPHPNIDGGTELVNTDFYVGCPVTYAAGKWSFRLRFYHISSHLGDEYMVNHPNVVRLNPSYEALDFASSWQITDAIRVYAFPGLIVHSDPSFPMDWVYIQYGTEARFGGQKFPYARLYGTWWFAFHIRNMQFLNWDFDGTYRAGYELSKLSGVGRKIRLWAGYHHGFSLEGQFQRERTHYWDVAFTYGF